MASFSKTTKDKNMEFYAEVFKSLAHPTRLEILKILLKNKNFNCGEIVNQLPIAQSTVSKHLMILKKSQIITIKQVGKKSMVSIKKNFFDDISHFMLNQFTITESIEDFIASSHITKKMNPNRSKHNKNRELKLHNYLFTNKKTKVS